jgi:hypothetical protein
MATLTIDEIFAHYYDSDHEHEQDHKPTKLVADEQDIKEWLDRGGLTDKIVVQKQKGANSMLKAMMIEPHSSDDEVNVDWKKAKQVKHMRRKNRLTEKKALYSKMALLHKLGMIKGPMLLFLQLELIKISKIILVLELERGFEARIPRVLCNRDLAPSFQYYDCISEITRVYSSEDLKFYEYNNMMVSTRRTFARSWSTRHLLKDKSKF